MNDNSGRGPALSGLGLPPMKTLVRDERCERCRFRSDRAAVIPDHKALPTGRTRTTRLNFADFPNSTSNEIPQASARNCVSRMILSTETP